MKHPSFAPAFSFAFAAALALSGATAVGCARPEPVTPTVTSADIGRDPSWSPPESGLSVDESKLPEVKEAAPRQYRPRPLPVPNARETSRGALRSGRP